MEMRVILGVATALVVVLTGCKPGEPSAGGSNEQVKKAESEHLVVLTTATFQKEVFENEQLVIVDFWAPWCPPCLELAPMVSELADKYAGKVKVGKVDVNETVNEALMEKYVKKGVGIPMVLFFKGGKKVEEVVGLFSKKELEELIAKHL